MKLVDELQVCKGFAICKGVMSANDIYDFSVANTSQSGTFSQLGYCVSGDAILYNDQTEIYLSVGNLYDARELHAKEFKIKSGEHGVSWLCINPMPADKFYTGELLRENDKRTIQGTDKEQVVICFDGYIKINDTIELSQFQYTRILNNTKVDVEVSANSLGLYFYTT